MAAMTWLLVYVGVMALVAPCVVALCRAAAHAERMGERASEPALTSAPSLTAQVRSSSAPEPEPSLAHRRPGVFGDWP